MAGGFRTIGRRSTLSQNEFIANIRRLAMEFERGKSAVDLMSEVLASMKAYDRKLYLKDGADE